MLYFAYGSNLNINQMQWRCPQAKPLRICTLPGYKLVFKGPLDIVPNKRCSVVGALYSITEQCEASLDVYEGFPFTYTKSFFDDEDGQYGLFYSVVNKRKIGPPDPYYYDTCYQGFKDWDLPVRRLQRAYEHAVVNKARKRAKRSQKSLYQHK